MISSIFEVPVSLAEARSGTPGTEGAIVSRVMESNPTIGCWLPGCADDRLGRGVFANPKRISISVTRTHIQVHMSGCMVVITCKIRYYLIAILPTHYKNHQSLRLSLVLSTDF